jgi:dTDP-4-dehydrorhamnose 3,5-epimerase
MPFTETGIPGLFVFEPDVFPDSRGYFYEAYSQNRLFQAGIAFDIVQENQSFSTYGVIRGLHFQLEPYSQSKLVRVIQGRILDVAVDIRKGSPTYGKSFSIELSLENKRQLFIPAGFAHGFSVLTETGILLYKCNKFYNKESEGGILYNDPSLNIDWGVPESDIVISGKDKELPLLSACEHNFVYEAT